MKKQKSKNGLKVSLELRPHHVLGFASHESHPEFYYLSDDEYIARFRQEKGYFHSDKLILQWRDAIKRLHEDFHLEFRYVQSIDSVCRGCEHLEDCHNSNHENYKIIEQADKYAIELLPELEFGKMYDGHYLKSLFRKRGWLKEEMPISPSIF